MVFSIFGCLFVKNIRNKVLFASMKSLINCENSSSNPLQEACCGFPMATRDSKAACDPECTPETN
jgi:hypothetical protein